MNFPPNFFIGASWVKDELMLWGQKVKGQGHSMTKYNFEDFRSCMAGEGIQSFDSNHLVRTADIGFSITDSSEKSRQVIPTTSYNRE